MGMCSTPEMPDYEAAARDSVYADLNTLPLRYMTDAASRMGTSFNNRGTTYDFTGLGEADNARVISDKMAQTLLDIQKNHGADFIKQRLNELKAADPEGYAARQQLFDRIMASADENPDRPLADNLQSAIVSELQKGGQLDAKGREQVQETVRGGQVGRGVFLGNAPAVQETSAMVKAGEAVRDSRQQQALDFLKSGTSPEDVEYRRFQQALSNLGNFVNGTTPTSQFGSLSSAGNAAAPFIVGGPNAATVNQNAAGQGANFASNIYSGKVNWAADQANPWLAGLSTGANSAAALGNMGYKWGGQ